MTTTHILDLVLALLIVGSLAGVCRIAFLVAGRRPLVERAQVELEQERRAA